MVDFFNFMTGPGGYGRECEESETGVGDFVQFHTKDGGWYHTAIITNSINDVIIIVYHSYDTCETDSMNGRNTIAGVESLDGDDIPPRFICVSNAIET